MKKLRESQKYLNTILVILLLASGVFFLLAFIGCVSNLGCLDISSSYETILILLLFLDSALYFVSSWAVLKAAKKYLLLAVILSAANLALVVGMNFETVDLVVLVSQTAILAISIISYFIIYKSAKGRKA